MRFLIDTHALLWLLQDDARVSIGVRQMLGDPDTESWVSIVSLWEIAIKARIGKLPIDPDAIVAAVAPSGFRLLELKTNHIAALSRLPRLPRHNDPFDHMLIAQAVAEELIFMSNDAYVAHYPVQRQFCSSAPLPQPP